MYFYSESNFDLIHGYLVILLYLHKISVKKSSLKRPAYKIITTNINYLVTEIVQALAMVILPFTSMTPAAATIKVPAIDAGMTAGELIVNDFIVLSP